MAIFSMHKTAIKFNENTPDGNVFIIINWFNNEFFAIMIPVMVLMIFFFITHKNYYFSIISKFFTYLNLKQKWIPEACSMNIERSPTVIR